MRSRESHVSHYTVFGPLIDCQPPPARVHALLNHRRRF